MAKRYIGIDLNEKYAMVSCYTPEMPEPNTISTVAGSEVYQIPVCLCKKRESRQWLYGEEAKKCAKEKGSFYVDGLLKKALAREQAAFEGTIYESTELLFVFLKKLLLLPPGGGEAFCKLVITTENMNLEYRKLFGLFAEWLKISKEQMMFLDYRESFYYYAFSQPAEICLHDVVLYYYITGKLFHWRLSRDKKTVPQVSSIEEKRYDGILKDRDESFAEIITEDFAGKVISSVYLIGDGFDGEWMKKSISLLCRNRRVFMGKNLFSKGACYAAAAKEEDADWPYIYMGDNELRLNISLKVENKGKSEFLTLITAGENWYEAGGECEVILNGNPSIELWFQPPKSMEASVRLLELTDLPKRKERTTRLRILAKPTAVDKVTFRIMDMGFGEIVRSTEKVWEYAVTI